MFIATAEKKINGAPLGAECCAPNGARSMGWACAAINIRSLQDCQLQRELRIAARISDCEFRIADLSSRSHSTAIIRRLRRLRRGKTKDQRPKIKDLR